MLYIISFDNIAGLIDYSLNTVDQIATEKKQDSRMFIEKTSPIWDLVQIRIEHLYSAEIRTWHIYLT